MISLRRRYFLNPNPDYKSTFGIPEIPINELIKNLDQITAKIELNLRPLEKHAGDGLYLGTAGIAYMYYHISKVPNLSYKKNHFLEIALEYLKPSLILASHSVKRKYDIPSFILGNSGIYAVASVIYKSIGKEVQCKQFCDLYYQAADICNEPLFLKCGSDELFVGRAGYILGAIWMSRETNIPLRKPEIYKLCKVIINSGREYAKRHHSPCSLMYSYYQVEYLGAAHGLCSILQVLLTVPGYLNSEPSDAIDIKNCIDFLLLQQDAQGNFPTATDEIGHPSELVHWCHGAGGMVYLMAKAYLTFKDDKYLKSCKVMADLVWEKGLLKKGPGICHGVSGNGYVFLLLYRLTKEAKYLYRAIQFFRFISTSEFQNGSRCPDYPYSLYEGWAGTACYVADLMCPLQATFPFSDVF